MHLVLLILIKGRSVPSICKCFHSLLIFFSCISVYVVLSELKLPLDNDFFSSGFRSISLFIIFRVQSKWTATEHIRKEILERSQIASIVYTVLILYLIQNKGNVPINILYL